MRRYLKTAATECDAGSRRAPHRAFTLVEALVSTALLVVVMFAVAQVFTISSDTAGRTVAHVALIQAASAFEHAVRTTISRVRPNGLLAIDSPQPLGNRADVPSGLNVLSLRHDRIVFIAQGAADEFESQTDRNVASANNSANDPAPPVSSGTGRLYASSEALVFYGPSFPDGRVLASQAGAGAVDAALAGKEWILAQRIILLGVPGVAFSSFTGETPSAYPAQLFASPAQGLFAGGIDAVTDTGDALIASALPPGNVNRLVELNACPSVVNSQVPSDATDNPGYYGRAAFNLQARVADLRIEWSDGSVVDPTDADPNPTEYQATDPATQWFGAPRDTTGAVGYRTPTDDTPAQGDATTKAQWLTSFPDPAWAAGGIESFDAGTQAYRAVWVPATWSLHPRALRFTFRVYDAQDRISTVEAVNRTPWTPSPSYSEPLRHYGLEYSFVVTVP